MTPHKSLVQRSIHVQWTTLAHTSITALKSFWLPDVYVSLSGIRQCCISGPVLKPPELLDVNLSTCTSPTPTPYFYNVKCFKAVGKAPYKSNPLLSAYVCTIVSPCPHCSLPYCQTNGLNRGRATWIREGGITVKWQLLPYKPCVWTWEIKPVQHHRGTPPRIAGNGKLY